ncbi:MAG: helicase-related protein, partial [Desulfovibrionales bacterium]
SVIVFTRTKHMAKKLAVRLSSSGHKSTSLQGNLSQRQRQNAMEGFRDGAFRVLVATDIAARGIDVSRVGHVINFDVPDTADAYTHRIGRTGRAERTGEAHTLVTREDTGLVRAVERIVGHTLTRKTLEGIEPAVLDDRGAARDQKRPARTFAKSGRPGPLPHARNKSHSQPPKRRKEKKPNTKRIFL